jgi:2-oxoglutarate dehydrogenase complex dehydrogenase (E1) component-like enzyme
MTNPITPPPELVQQWEEQFLSRPTINGCFIQSYIAAKSAQWGLKISLDWLLLNGYGDAASRLSAALRPKPRSLKEQALGALSRADKDALTNPLTGEVVALRTILSKEQSDTIRRALEALND